MWKKCTSERTTQLAKHKIIWTAVLEHYWCPTCCMMIEYICDRKYSTLPDESTDPAVNQYLDSVTRYFSEYSQTLVSTFLHHAPLTECDADDTVDALKSSSEVYGVNLHNITDTKLTTRVCRLGSTRLLPEGKRTDPFLSTHSMCTSSRPVGSVTYKFWNNA